MAKRLFLLPKKPIFTLTSTPQNPRPVAFPHFFCSELETQKPHEDSTEKQDPDKLRDEERHEQIRKIRILIQQGRRDTAQRLINSLVSAKSHFSSPSDLFSLFSISAPSVRPTFSNLLFSACLESKMVNEALELYGLMKKDGVFPSLNSVNLLLEALVSLKIFGKILEWYYEIVDAGVIRPESCIMRFLQYVQKILQKYCILTFIFFFINFLF